MAICNSYVSLPEVTSILGTTHILGIFGDMNMHKSQLCWCEQEGTWVVTHEPLKATQISMPFDGFRCCFVGFQNQVVVKMSLIHL
jgi:hypothetical protein